MQEFTLLASWEDMIRSYEETTDPAVRVVDEPWDLFGEQEGRTPVEVAA